MKISIIIIFLTASTVATSLFSSYISYKSFDVEKNRNINNSCIHLFGNSFERVQLGFDTGCHVSNYKKNRTLESPKKQKVNK